jgi:hypothetical protein
MKRVTISPVTFLVAPMTTVAATPAIQRPNNRQQLHLDRPRPPTRPRAISLIGGSGRAVDLARR